MLAVTDTHALLWALTGQTRKLGRKARMIYAHAEARKATIYIPAFVLVEISELVHLGKLRLPAEFGPWAAALSRSGSFVVHDLTLESVLLMDSLFAIPERSDRIIAASARQLDCPLITRDADVAESAAVERVWD
jgi:PIN domain nuclease of toxin-antitoxin system